MSDITYLEHLKRYNTNEEGESKEASFLQKYWLHSEEYAGRWKDIKTRIFASESTDLPDMMFNLDYLYMINLGGCLLVKDEFLKLKKCMLELGEEYFVIVENYDFKNPPHDDIPIRLKFSSKISWDELMSGGYFSYDVFQRPIRNYFIYGMSGSWGKYAANDYTNFEIDAAGTPLEIIGFKRAYKDLFIRSFKEENPKINDWIPEVYKSDRLL